MGGSTLACARTREEELMRVVVDAEIRERIAQEAEWYRPRKQGLDEDFLGEVGKA